MWRIMLIPIVCGMILIIAKRKNKCCGKRELTGMGKKARKLGTDFTKGYIPVLLIRFLIPFLLANILEQHI